MGKTKINWATDVWNPVTGCDPVSAGCTNCYAKRMANRLRGRYGYPRDDPFKVTLHHDRLDQPLHWRKPRMIFVCSMGDLFHKDVPNSFLRQVFWVMRMYDSDKHIFVILTKRPKRLARFVNSLESYPNIWPGVSVEDQKTADERIGELLKVDAAVRVVSYEPALASLDIEESIYKSELRLPESDGWGINWVIAGAETGSNRRECKLEWIRAVKDQCQLAGVPFFLKALYEDGKKLSTPVLDGRTWDQMPELS